MNDAVLEAIFVDVRERVAGGPVATLDGDVGREDAVRGEGDEVRARRQADHRVVEPSWRGKGRRRVVGAREQYENLPWPKREYYRGRNTRAMRRARPRGAKPRRARRRHCVQGSACGIVSAADTAGDE